LNQEFTYSETKPWGIDQCELYPQYLSSRNLEQFLALRATSKYLLSDTNDEWVSELQNEWAKAWYLAHTEPPKCYITSITHWTAPSKATWFFLHLQHSLLKFPPAWVFIIRCLPVIPFSEWPSLASVLEERNATPPSSLLLCYFFQSDYYSHKIH
jgi:hypothetical protein